MDKDCGPVPGRVIGFSVPFKVKPPPQPIVIVHYPLSA